MVTILRNATVIQGGDLKHPWVPDTISVVSDVTFIKLMNNDRRFASFCGANLSVPSPLKYNRFLLYIQKMRNDSVANEMDMVSRKTPDDKRTRKDLFDEIPKVVTVKTEPFESEGVAVGECSIRVLSTASPLEAISVELDETVLALVRAGVMGNCGPTLKKQRREQDSQVRFPEFPNARWNYVRDAPYCVYTDTDGRRKNKQISPKKSDDVDLAREYSHKAAQDVQAWHTQHCSPSPTSEAGDQAEGGADDEAVAEAEDDGTANEENVD